MHVPKDTASVVLLLAVLTLATLVVVGQAMMGLDVFLLVSTVLVLVGGALAVFVPKAWTRVLSSVLFVLFAAMLVRVRVAPSETPSAFAVAMAGNLGTAAIAVAAVGAAAGIVLVGLKPTPAPAP